jgi:hypothetical protein
MPELFPYAYLTTAVARSQQSAFGWTEFRNERFGLALSYPADVFVSQRSSESGDCDLFETPDRKGRLLIGAIRNRDGFSPRSYQSFIATQSIRDCASTTRRLVKAGRCYPARSGRQWSTKKSCLAAAAMSSTVSP